MTDTTHKVYYCVCILIFCKLSFYIAACINVLILTQICVSLKLAALPEKGNKSVHGCFAPLASGGKDVMLYFI